MVRTSRGVTLTEAGRVLAEHAQAVTARLRAAHEDLTALAELRAGRVRLAAFPSACATFVPEALARLRGRAPGLDVRLTEAEPPQARQLLADGDVDLAVTFAYDCVPEQPADDEQPPAAPLFNDDMLLVLPGSHGLGARAEASPGSPAAPAAARTSSPRPPSKGSPPTSGTAPTTPDRPRSPAQHRRIGA